MKLTLDNTVIDVSPNEKGYTATVGDKNVAVEVLYSKDGKLDLLIDGQRVTAYVSSDGAKRWVTVNGQTIVLTRSSGTQRGGHRNDHAGGLAAPMPGLVRSVAVSEGDKVKKGQTLLTLEAMKMEIRIQSPKDGKVKIINVKQGQTVEREQILIEVEE
jgi:biotin carboxyl carrier protein